MSTYLTEQWATELTKALNEDSRMPGLIAGQDAMLQMNVSGGPQGDCSFYYLFEDGQATVALGEGDGPDVTGTLDYEDAAKIARGELNGQSAVMTGKMKMQGNMGKIMSLGKALDQMTVVQNTLDVQY